MSLCHVTLAPFLGLVPLKNQEATAPPISEWDRPNGSVCIPSHLLQTTRAGEVVRTSQVHCLVGANARTKSGRAPPSANPGDSWDSAQRKGVGRKTEEQSYWTQSDGKNNGTCSGRYTPSPTQRYAFIPEHSRGTLLRTLLKLSSWRVFRT